MKDYYRILDVNYHSSQEDIETAYKIAYNQIISGNNRIKDLIEEAYGVLSSPDERQKYNQAIYMFSKESGVSINTPYSNINSLDEMMNHSMINQDGENIDELNHENSNNTRVQFLHKFMKYEYGAIVFGLLSACLILVLLFGRDGGENMKSMDTDRTHAHNPIVTENQGNLPHNTSTPIMVDPTNQTTTIDNTSSDNQTVKNTSNSNTNNPNSANANNTSNNSGSNDSSTQLTPESNQKDSTHKITSIPVTPHNPKILYKTENHQSFAYEDRIKWMALVHEQRYLLKDPYPELDHDEKVEQLNTATEEFFDRAFMNIKQEGSDSTIKNVFVQNNGDITYHVYDNTAYMLIFLPVLYVVQEFDDVTNEDIFLFVLYELSVVDGGVYGIFTPMNPYANYVTEKFSDINLIHDYQYPWFEYISVESARTIHNDILNNEINLNYVETVIVEKDLKDSYLKLSIPSPELSVIEKYQENYAERTYAYKLYDPYDKLTEIEKVALLNDDPESFFDAMLTGIKNKNEVTLKDVFHKVDASWEYLVENNKAYMYITTPITRYKSDGYNAVYINNYFFFMFEIAVLPDGVYAKHEITKPFLLLIKDKRFFQGVTPEDFDWEYAIIGEDGNPGELITRYRYYSEQWAYTSEIEKLTIRPIYTP